jgi:hypothetical protein
MTRGSHLRRSCQTKLKQLAKFEKYVRRVENLSFSSACETAQGVSRKSLSLLESV